MRIVPPLAVRKPQVHGLGAYALNVAVELAVRAIAPAVAAVVLWAAFVVTMLGVDDAAPRN